VISDLVLPPVELRFMAEDDDRLIRIGKELAGLLSTNGLQPMSRVLDIGCGYGRLALGLLAEGHHTGDYLGFDILPKQIGWCAEHITPIVPRYRFKHFNLVNSRYNPDGKLDPDTFRMPTGVGSVDMAAAFSVFTHLYRATIEHYLAELRRVLRPGGVAVTTWLLWDEDRLPAVESDACAYPLRFQLDQVTRYSDDADQLRAIAYRRDAVTEMVNAAGLRIRSLTLGSWDGATRSDVFQDLVVIELPGTLRLHASRRLRRKLRG
jgi:SAM-dependent methyltransferase